MAQTPEDAALSLTDERRERLGRAGGAQAAQYNPRYSRFIRRMKLILPLVALIITGVVFAWGSMDEDNIIPSALEASIPKTVGQNELLNPRFESTDDKKQPYTITAGRAIQGENNDNLIILEEPVADLLLNSGSWVAVKADQGAFRQDSQNLLLRGNVRLYHDRGYQLETAQMQINLEDNSAFSEDDVHGKGPAGTLEAKGLQANSGEGHIIFNGPAKLVLNRKVQGTEQTP